jgi:hypothetical protein
MDPYIKYKNAYYYEMPNQEFHKALVTVLNPQDDETMSEWNDSIDPATLSSMWRNTYDAWVTELTKRIEESKAFELTGSKERVQVVHDRWISAATHKTQSNLLRIDMETILYRYGTPHGKHVQISVMVNQKEDEPVTFTVLKADVVGIVPEDHIALFPVIASNPFDKNQMTYQEDPKTFSNTIIPPANEVLTLMNNHLDQYMKLTQTKMKTG